MLDKIDDKKTYYSISEVCEETLLEQHVLRYWETEFPQLRPKKNRARNRAYRLKDIKLIKYIKHLLYNEHFTIVGAKKKLSETSNYEIETQMQLPLPIIKPADPNFAAILRKDIQEVLKILQKK
jgi:DNA-binding transcriptional MerR regulator